MISIATFSRAKNLKYLRITFISKMVEKAEIERSNTNLSSRSRVSAYSGRSSRFSKYTKASNEEIEEINKKPEIDFDTDIEGRIKA